MRADFKSRGKLVNGSSRRPRLFLSSSHDHRADCGGADCGGGSAGYMSPPVNLAGYMSPAATKVVIMCANPPQLVYFHSFSKRKGMVVFVDMRTNVVRGFIPTKDINGWKRKLTSRAK